MTSSKISKKFDPPPAARRPSSPLRAVSIGFLKAQELQVVAIITIHKPTSYGRFFTHHKSTSYGSYPQEAFLKHAGLPLCYICSSQPWTGNSMCFFSVFMFFFILIIIFWA